MRFGSTVGLLLRKVVMGVGLTTSGAAGSPPVPVIVVSGSHIVAENSPVGTVIGVASVSYGTGTYAWTLFDSGPGSHIGLTDLGNGTAQVKVASNIDFETQPSIDIQLLANNGVDTPTFATLTITVGNVYEAPVVGGFAALLKTLGII